MPGSSSSSSSSSQLNKARCLQNSKGHNLWQRNHSNFDNFKERYCGLNVVLRMRTQVVKRLRTSRTLHIVSKDRKSKKFSPGGKHGLVFFTLITTYGVSVLQAAQYVSSAAAGGEPLTELAGGAGLQKVYCTSWFMIGNKCPLFCLCGVNAGWYGRFSLLFLKWKIVVLVYMLYQTVRFVCCIRLSEMCVVSHCQICVLYQTAVRFDDSEERHCLEWMTALVKGRLYKYQERGGGLMNLGHMESLQILQIAISNLHLFTFTSLTRWE